MWRRQRLAVLLEAEQEAQQVVGRLGAPLLDVSAQVAVDLAERTGPDFGLGRADLEQLVQPDAEAIAVVVGQPEHLSDHEHGNVLRVLRRGIDRSGRIQPFEDVTTDLAGDRFPSVDLPRCERRQQHAARRRMVGRIARDRRRDARHLVGGALVHDHGPRREVLGVVGDGSHIVVSSHQVGTVEAVGVGDRATLAEIVEDRVLISTPRRIEVVEIRRPIADRVTLSVHVVPPRNGSYDNPPVDNESCDNGASSRGHREGGIEKGAG